MLVARENFQPQDFESRGRLLQNSVVLDLLSDEAERAPAGEVDGQYRSYSLLCAAMQADDGEMLVVRKDPYVDSQSRSDWLVAKVSSDPSGEPVFSQENVLAANIHQFADNDFIELMLSQDQDAHRGPNVVSFSVDKMYRPLNDQPVELGYLNRYGERMTPQGMMTKTLKSYQNPIETVNYSQVVDQSAEFAPISRLDLASGRLAASQTVAVAA